MAYNGELKALVSAIGRDEIPELLSVRGFEYNLAHANFSTSTKQGGSSVNSFNGDNIELECPRVKRQFTTNMWNPGLFAIYNNQIEIVKFLLNEPQITNKALCLSTNEF
jgi:hypothetical protein